MRRTEYLPLASMFLCVKTLIGSAAHCTGWRALPACWRVLRLGLDQVLEHLAKSPVFFRWLLLNYINNHGQIRRRPLNHPVLHEHLGTH